MNKARLLATATLLLAGCTGTLPPVHLYNLASAPPVAVVNPVASTQVWQLMNPVRVPEYLDREAILVPQGDTGLMLLSGHRWAETLRDSVPRVLRHDLSALLGEARVWPATLPPGVTATRQLRVELLAFEITRDRTAVRLSARWSVADPAGATAARSQQADIVQAAGGAGIDSLVAAHRLAMWKLAERIASSP